MHKSILHSGFFQWENFHEFHKSSPFTKILPLKCLLQTCYHYVLLTFHEKFPSKSWNKSIREKFSSTIIQNDYWQVENAFWYSYGISNSVATDNAKIFLVRKWRRKIVFDTSTSAACFLCLLWGYTIILAILVSIQPDVIHLNPSLQICTAHSVKPLVTRWYGTNVIYGIAEKFDKFHKQPVNHQSFPYKTFLL